MKPRNLLGNVNDEVCTGLPVGVDQIVSGGEERIIGCARELEEETTPNRHRGTVVGLMPQPHSPRSRVIYLA